MTVTLRTPEQAAEFLVVEVQTLAVWRSTRRYDLPFTKIGRAVRYKQSDLDRFVESRTVGTLDPNPAA